jgi:hypothetical protein
MTALPHLAPAIRKHRGPRVDISLQNLARRLHNNGDTRRPLTVEEMKTAIVADRDPYRDWFGAYMQDVRRGHGGRVVTGTFASNRTPVPRPYRRDNSVLSARVQTTGTKGRRLTSRSPASSTASAPRVCRSGGRGSAGNGRHERSEARTMAL